MLTKRDIEQIRLVVREELKRALSLQPAPVLRVAEVEVASDELDEPQREALHEFARWTARVMRGEPGAAEQELRAEAAYRGRYDAGWIVRARRKLGMTGDGPLELEDAVRALRLLRPKKYGPPGGRNR